MIRARASGHFDGAPRRANAPNGFASGRAGSNTAATVVLLLSSAPASASDYTGMIVFLVGLPLFVALNLFLGISLARRAKPERRLLASALVVVAMLVAPLVAIDALGTIVRGGWPGRALAIGFFLLVGLALVLYYRLVLKPRPMPRMRR